VHPRHVFRWSRPPRRRGSQDILPLPQIRRGKNPLSAGIPGWRKVNDKVFLPNLCQDKELWALQEGVRSEAPAAVL